MSEQVLLQKDQPRKPRHHRHQLIKSKDTIEFLGTWEVMHNPGFNLIEFDKVKNEARTNRFILSVAVKGHFIPPKIAGTKLEGLYYATCSIERCADLPNRIAAQCNINEKVGKRPR